MRHFIKGLIGVVILIILVWLGSWYYAETRLKQLVMAQINAINATGTEQVSYDQIITSHSPLVISLALLNPKLEITQTSGPQSFSISTARIGGHIDLLNPFLLHFDLPHSFTLSGPGGSGALTFATATATETLPPSIWLGHRLNSPITGDADFTGLDLLASNGSLELAQIDQLSLHQTTNPSASLKQTAVTSTVLIQNFRVAPIFTRMFNLPFNGTISRLALSFTLSGPLNEAPFTGQNMDMQNDTQRKKLMLQSAYEWAKAGGHGQGHLDLLIGPSALTTDFTLGFDQQIQPKGTVEISADHLITFGTTLANSSPGLVDVINRIYQNLRPYLSDNGNVLNMHIAYNQSGVFLNSQKFDDMPFLDWNQLLNPKTAPSFAPGDGSGAAQP